MKKIIALLCSFGIFSLPLYPLPVKAQSPSNNIIRENSNIYDNDRLRFVIQTCARKQEDLICQGTVASKITDRQIEFNLSNIKLVDVEGNEYYPSSLTLANRSSENNSLKTELVVNINVKTTLVFSKIPASVKRIALLNIPLEIEQDTAIAKFRNLSVAAVTDGTDKTSPKLSTTSTTSKDNGNTNKPKSKLSTTSTTSKDNGNTNKPKSKLSATSTNSSNDNQDLSLICPEKTKILYRAASKNNLLFICGAKNPAYFVTQAKDGSQGMTLRLRSYNKKRFSADNGNVNYAIGGDQFTVTKNGKVVSQEKISILQPLVGSTATNSAPKKQPTTNSNRVTKNSGKLRSSESNNPKTKPGKSR
jgi:hypothetical protein